REEAVAALDAAGVPAGPIYTAEDLVADDQLRSRGMIQHMDVSTGEEVLHDVAFPGVSPRIGTAPNPVRTLGPDLGEHTEEVLGAISDRLGDDPADDEEVRKVSA